MATAAQYAATPKVGRGFVGIADTSRVAPSIASTIFTAGTSGSRIDSIDIVGMGTTGNTVVRLWIYDGTYYSLWKESVFSSTTPSATVAVASANYSSADNTSFMPLILPSGSSLRASVNDTQSGAAGVSLATVGASQAVTSGVNALINGTAITAANTTSVAAAATQAGAAFYTLTSAVVYNTAPALVSLTSTGNISGVNFTITGTNALGATISETIAGPNNNTVYTLNPFVTVSAVYCNGAVGTNTSVGVGATVATIVPTNLTIASTANLSGVNFTVVGIDRTGTTVSETLTGPAAGTVVFSANTYRSICRITPNGTVSEGRFGTGIMPFGFAITARGGDF